MRFNLINSEGDYLQEHDPRDPCRFAELHATARSFPSAGEAMKAAIECNVAGARPALVANDGAVWLFDKSGGAVIFVREDRTVLVLVRDVEDCAEMARMFTLANTLVTKTPTL